MFIKKGISYISLVLISGLFVGYPIKSLATIRSEAEPLLSQLKSEVPPSFDEDSDWADIREQATNVLSLLYGGLEGQYLGETGIGRFYLVNSSSVQLRLLDGSTDDGYRYTLLNHSDSPQSVTEYGMEVGFLGCGNNFENSYINTSWSLLIARRRNGSIRSTSFNDASNIYSDDGGLLFASMMPQWRSIPDAPFTRWMYSAICE